ncbi:hypothetical protein EK21DRAFT_106400 [Setomelanomma holmii]|uniref:Uncharacterized protein n=1 Tax=Setomelanomma holmii TaxID=210430 RepID=A0A9P4LV22_9PLEO|nr:hypothetical protein EK21DRAFT_106400 [Setomelanomma holmii]
MDGAADLRATPVAVPVSIDPEAFTTESLKKLQSKDERRLLDVITEIPFPRKAGLCTRFATEIVLRRQSTDSVTIKINPSKSRMDAEKFALSSFSKTITDLNELPAAIDDATRAMGLGEIGRSAAFSKDILSVEICGPDRPQLTLVDLPGLIHSATKASTEADKDLIHGLVQEYMQNPRTIILAVVSAKNDAANQIILSLFKKIDKKGSRTLGIITKPDCMSSGDEQFWFDLAQNKEVFLERGWHMVKNRSEVEMAYSFAERNEAEMAFFDRGRFKDLPRSAVGIEALRERLSGLLHRHLVQELPSLKQELKAKLVTTEQELASLGEPRETPQEQNMLLTTISSNINLILRDALNGTYLHPFFDPVDMDAPITYGTNVRRFRAVIQDLNSKFAENMRLYGHKYEPKTQQFAPPPQPPMSDDEDGDGLVMADSEDELPQPKQLTQDDFMAWVKKVMLRCRGHELPGSVNPEITSHLFWEQSEPWKHLAKDHVEQVRSLCKYFIHQILNEVAPAEFKKPLEELVVSAVLEDTLKDAKVELKKLLEDKARNPSTYNHYYTDNIQKRRKEKLDAANEKAKRAANIKTRRDDGTYKTTFDKDIFYKELEKTVQRDMEIFAAEETLESSRAYYKDEMKYFVHAVTKQVIERCMIDPLPRRILSPTVVQALTDEEVAFVAAEPPETVAQRAFLEERKQMLEKGDDIFREAMGGVKRGRAAR